MVSVARNLGAQGHSAASALAPARVWALSPAGHVLQMSATVSRRVGDNKSHPTLHCRVQVLHDGGGSSSPSSFCSGDLVQGPLSCSPGSPLLLWRCSWIAAGVAAHSPFWSSVSVTLPPMVSWVGLFWGICSGGEGQMCFIFLAATQQVLMLGRASALLERDIGDPLVIAPALFAVTGYLHQTVALPGI